MILAITFSKPSKDCELSLGKPYIKVRIKKRSDSALRPTSLYEAEYFTQTQAFTKTMDENEVLAFKEKHTGTTFKNVVERTESEEIAYLTNRHGETKQIRRKTAGKEEGFNAASGNRTKKYIIQEGTPVPFLIKLGVMTKDGKVIAAKYDKFRQINRFLEYVRDILPQVKKLKYADSDSDCQDPIRIADFGCGKSYLTFAVYHYLTNIEKLNVSITGIDLKKDVIEHCTATAKELGYDNLHFHCGNVEAFKGENADIIITLHACDTATDYALKYAVDCKTKAILSVPCCQHEINLQLEGKSFEENSPFASLTRYGIIRERLAALATDSLRAEYLEQEGYSVQILEFIDMEGTPKNLLIRAVRRQQDNDKAKQSSQNAAELSAKRSQALIETLGVKQKLNELLGS